MSDVSGSGSSPDITPAPRPRRFRPRGIGSIQSKLLVMLLLSSILSAAVVGFFAYRTGTQSLKDAAYDRLTEVRSERTRAIEDYAANIRGAVVLDSQGVGVEASKAFNSGFADLADAKVTASQRARIATYYDDVFVPGLKENTSGDIEPDAFIPSKPARSYLQATYTAQFDDFDQALLSDDAGDGSEWTEANAEFNPYFRSVVTELGLDDAMLLDSDGNVVYTAYKGVDLGSNIKVGEYKGGALEQVFDQASRANSRDFVAVADFEQYQPAYNDPTLFIASPVGAAGKLTGVLVYEVSADKINQVMTGGPAKGVQGLGDTGETFLVGPDNTMRSNSRILIEDPKRFSKLSIARGTDPAAVERIVRTESSILLQPVKSEAARRASLGQSGTILTTDYLGEKVLDSYGPVKLQGLDWTIIAKIDSDEALAPVDDFARNILLATAAIILLVSAASVLMARVFTTPLNRLLTGVRSVAGGNLGAQVDATSRDEFGDLAVAFNDMSSSLASKQEMLTAQQDENERLLGSLMPPPVVKRYRGGETAISDEHQDVSVAFTEVEGFDAFAGGLPAAEALELLNSLSRGFDEAAAKAGVEKVRSAGTSYVASSGLVLQRVDHVRRVVDFALDVAGMTERFNSQHGASLVMRAGVHTGDVRSGLVGRSDVVYNLWGEAVNLAYRLRTAAGEAGIYVTDDVKDQLGGAYAFEQAGTVADGASESPVWRVLRGAAS